ncbi:MAG: 16S rRNA (guanine(966)-N(2))-methyltransferase RsmD [Candidatus Obscuribacterales bacterium]|nr:16S rRNA (guanine(966)-N(2))-methyltransferase RsmD [Candidatus Obscuribacterales bacterium]
MSLRITGGGARGRVITSPRGLEVRPTSSKIRQALFNILSGRLNNAKFLDLFAGSGLMGMEALSRGAKSLVAVELERTLADNIKESLDQFGFEGDVITGDVRQVLSEMRGQKFDIIFADPPYKSGLAGSTVQLVDRYGLLQEDGLLIIEHAKSADLPVEKISVKLTKQREYGRTCLSFFDKQVTEE